MEYLIFTGAPGSKWSSVVKNIYWSTSINQSDYSDERTYWHDADTPGNKHLMHIGAYWDPGMEFETDKKCWDAPFDNSKGVKLIKSHVFAYHLNELKKQNDPIVLVYRSDIDCYNWWNLCGQFNITYPNYGPYYQNLANMWIEIQKQNSAIQNFIYNNNERITEVFNNYALAGAVNISSNGIKQLHDYKQKGVQVYVYK